MKCIAGIWLPDHERHLADWMLNDQNARVIDGKATYQFNKLEAAMNHCRAFRVAIDIGAHVGTWSMHLATRFEAVHAFEPIEEHRKCFRRNVQHGKVELYPVALGAAPGMVALTTRESSSGDTFISGPGEIEMHALDDYGFEYVDFIKVDIEGYELEALKGAAETLRRCRPCVIVEQKAKNLARNFGASGTPAVDFLSRLGAKVRVTVSGDYIMTWARA